MARGPNSIYFCGVKLVRWGYRPRRAVKVMIGHMTLALLRDGSVACSIDSPFDERKRGWRVDPRGQTYLNEALADGLLAIGAITAKAHTEHKAQLKARLHRRELRDAASDIQSAAELLGVTLTAEQKKLIARVEEAT